MTNPSKILENKIALVTGAGSGVAQAIALGLAEAGAKVVLVGRTMAKLEQTKSLILQKGESAVSIAADVGEADVVKKMSEEVLWGYGVPSILVNGAGIHGEVKPIKESNPGRWTETFMINTIGPYLVCRAFINEMVEQGWGRIVNISSAASLGKPGGVNSAYAASKSALNHFTRQLAAELENTGVTANVLHPGEVKTEMWADIRDDILSSGTENMRRWVDWVDKTGGDPPEKAVKLVLSLLNDEAGSINGRFLWIEDGLKQPMPSWE